MWFVLKAQYLFAAFFPFSWLLVGSQNPKFGHWCWVDLTRSKLIALFIRTWLENMFVFFLSLFPFSSNVQFAESLNLAPSIWRVTQAPLSPNGSIWRLIDSVVPFSFKQNSSLWTPFQCIRKIFQKNLKIIDLSGSSK